MNALDQLLQTVQTLRSPNGCPWDKKQTFQSLRPFLIEEAYELLEVLDQVNSPSSLKGKLKQNMVEELGDVLLQILLHSQIASETKKFDFEEVCKQLNSKLIRRHPHVFGDQDAKDDQEALGIWKAQKQKEKKRTLFESIPKELPALKKADATIKKVTQVGFQWPDLKGPLAKLKEEISELEHELEASNPDSKRISEELGDVLFCICNLASFHKISSEDALREMLKRFQKRFEKMESLNQKSSLEELSLEEMDQLWNVVKAEEKN